MTVNCSIKLLLTSQIVKFPLISVNPRSIPPWASAASRWVSAAGSGEQGAAAVSWRAERGGSSWLSGARRVLAGGVATAASRWASGCGRVLAGGAATAASRWASGCAGSRQAGPSGRSGCVSVLKSKRGRSWKTEDEGPSRLQRCLDEQVATAKLSEQG